MSTSDRDPAPLRFSVRCLTAASPTIRDPCHCCHHPASPNGTESVSARSIRRPTAIAPDIGPAPIPPPGTPTPIAPAGPPPSGGAPPAGPTCAPDKPSTAIESGESAALTGGGALGLAR